MWTETDGISETERHLTLSDSGDRQRVMCLEAEAVVAAFTPGQHLFIFSAPRSADHEPGLLTDPIFTEPEGVQGSGSRRRPDWRCLVHFKEARIHCNITIETLYDSYQFSFASVLF